jgi:hypothetical protein
MTTTLPLCLAYKDSGMPWLGRIPTLWKWMSRKGANKGVIVSALLRQLRVTCEARDV